MTKIKNNDTKRMFLSIILSYLIFCVMDFKSIEFKKLLVDFYRAFLKLPNYGKVLAVASIATLYLAIFPSVKQPIMYKYEWNRIELNEKGEKVFLRKSAIAKDGVPSFYVNSSQTPKPKDTMVILDIIDDDTPYMFKEERGTNVFDWVEAVYDYKKSAKRKKMAASFLFSITLAMASYPGLIRRLWNLIPKK